MNNIYKNKNNKMMMKRFFKIALFVFLLICTITFTAAAAFLLTPTSLELDEKLLIDTSDFACFYDTHNNLVSSETSYLDINEELPAVLKHTVISAEDKNFYSHSGIDYLRIIKAAFVNLKNGNYSQGASTISQQLIKNTHLEQDKTIKRKLNEIKLAQKLEQIYSKDEILNMYLNTVYFGQNVYGIKNAAKYYFSKDISDLDLNECATLAGIVPSPAKYNPIANKSLSLKMRNEVLSRMKRNGYITQSEYDETIKLDIVTNLSDSDDVLSSYIDGALEEIYSNSDLTPYDLANAHVYTYLDHDMQNVLKDSKTEDDKDYASIIIDNETLGVTAYFCTCNTQKRSPASTIKPLLVYAPAIDKGIVYEMMKINDEKSSFEGWSPSNYRDIYYGEVSLKFALANSLNTPAVALYNSLGKEYCKDRLSRLGISDTNNNPDLSLGRFDEGVTIKEIAQAYAAFPNGGVYSPARFVKKITDRSGKVIYSEDKSKERVFSEGTATIINDMLYECAKNGTAKKIGVKSYPVYAKTGTNGNENGNTDAYVSFYTSKNTMCCWYGYADSKYMDNSVTGGSTPCFSANYILDNIYSRLTPAPIEKRGVVTLYIDKQAYDEKGEFLLAGENSLPKDRYEFIFDERFYPTAVKTVTPPESGNILFFFDGDKLGFLTDENFKAEISSEPGLPPIFDGYIKDFSGDANENATYYITPYVLDGKKKIYGETVKKTAAKDKKQKSTVPSEWWEDR